MFYGLLLRSDNEKIFSCFLCLKIFGATTLSIMTLSIMTLSIMTLSIMILSIMGLFATLSIHDTQHK
jgi:hypothetical protein